MLAVAGCSHNSALDALRPRLDMDPVGCGYKWFQAGYSPAIRIPCEADRSHLRATNISLAREHAWHIAGQRCPDTCEPTELQDSVEWKNPMPNGACRNGYAYFSTRVFFRCGG
jgi:hypothetical protein